MRLIELSAAVGISIGLSATVVAQTASEPELPPVELAVGVDGTWLRAGLYLDENVTAEPMMHLRVTVPMTRNLAMEGIFAVSKQFNTNVIDYRTEALYAIQVKQTVWRSLRGGFFATYGAVGSLTRAWTFDTLHPPYYLIAGGGFQWEFARLAALRTEMQGVLLAGFAPMGVRLSTGLSIPMRRYR